MARGGIGGQSVLGAGAKGSKTCRMARAVHVGRLVLFFACKDWMKL